MNAVFEQLCHGKFELCAEHGVGLGDTAFLCTWSPMPQGPIFQLHNAAGPPKLITMSRMQDFKAKLKT